MIKTIRHFLCFVLSGLLLGSCSLFENDKGQFAGNDTFTALTGINVNLPSEIKKELINNSDKWIYFDSTDHSGGSGDHFSGYYFIDKNEIHGDSRQPLIVKVIDEDRDMGPSGKGDTDSDVYIAYWNGGSSVNGIIDYLDRDQDGYADVMYMYGVVDGRLYITYSEDIGGDHKLFSHSNYVYTQEADEWSSDFNGDEYFVFNFYRDPFNGKLVPEFETAFGFFNLDDDSYAESAIRLEGRNDIVESTRISFDLDDDNQDSWPHQHDYDFSISAVGSIDLNNYPAFSKRFLIRGVETEPVVPWDRLKEFAFSAGWDRHLLTWDEHDNNVYPLGKYLYERWEGVINEESPWFPRVGGPSGGPFNKRNEIAAGGGMDLYYCLADRRIHLKNMEKGWLNVDYDFDKKTDLLIEYADTDKNGFIDKITYDFNMDGTPERVQPVGKDLNRELPFDYEELSPFYQSVLDQCVKENEQVIRALKEELSEKYHFNKTLHIEFFYNEALKNYWGEFKIGEKIAESREGQRYYTSLIREYYWYQLLKRASTEDPRVRDLITAYDRGDYAAVITWLSAS